MSFLQCMVWDFVKSHMAVSEWVYFWVFILFHWSSCLFCISTMLFLLLWLCCIIEQYLWYLQHYSFSSEILLLFGVFCVSMWILRLSFPFLWGMTLGFWQDCIDSGDCFQQYSHFHNINSDNPWTWEVFSSFDIFNFF
jgi:hypothetical protein